jgi:predicted RNA binding protein YcfA (HicA-like mRNA interferase family)
VKLPRDLSGHELAKMLRRYGYEVVRQSGSHIQLKSKILGTDHTVTVPAHKVLRLGTLNSILSRIADYLKMTRPQLIEELFEK